MPRVRTRLDKRKDQTKNLIRNSMRNVGITQKQLAADFGKTQSAFSQNMRNMSFTYAEFLFLAEKLGWSDEEKANCLTL